MSHTNLPPDAATNSILPIGLTKAYDLDITFENAKVQAEIAKFRTQTLPPLFCQHNVQIQETIVFLYYLILLSDTESALLGTDSESKAQVLKYISYAADELMGRATLVAGILLGKLPYNEDALEKVKSEVNKYVTNLESRLVDKPFLVGETLTAADLYVASCFYRFLTLTFGVQWRAEHPIFMKWFKSVVKHKTLAYFFDTVELIDEPVKPLLPPQKKSKPKNPLETLEKPALSLITWKRIYTNKNTREEALPYFWETFYNDENWSLWKVDYKYNDELTFCFRSINLIGGFFNRLSASVKYMFGCCVVYGENNNNGITGAFIIQGHDPTLIFNVAPEWESFSYTRLDAFKKEDREFVDNVWAMDNPIFVDGENKQIDDGKVLKCCDELRFCNALEHYQGSDIVWV